MLHLHILIICIFRTVNWMNPKNFPRFTLILQSLAELAVSIEAILRFLPEIFIDTTGCPLSLPLFKYIGGCKTACYVHYPTITTQMIRRVETGVEMYNNSGMIANNEALTTLKVWYYRIFALIYKLAGKSSDVVMVNGRFVWNLACNILLILFTNILVGRKNILRVCGVAAQLKFFLLWISNLWTILNEPKKVLH